MSYPLFRHSSLRVLQGVGVAVDAFEVAAFRQFPRQFYADGTRRIVIMCYQEFVGKTVMVFHFFNLGITLEQVLAEEAMRFPQSGFVGDLPPRLTLLMPSVLQKWDAPSQVHPTANLNNQ